MSNSHVNTPATPTRAALREHLPAALFFLFLGLPLAFIAYAVLAWFALRAGTPLRVAQVAGFILVPAGAWLIARSAVRGRPAHAARDGRIIEDAPLWPKPLPALLTVALTLLIVVPLFFFSATFFLANVLLNIAIVAAIFWLILRAERRDLRKRRRTDGRCQRCGYPLADAPGPCPECADPNAWRTEPA